MNSGITQTGSLQNRRGGMWLRLNAQNARGKRPVLELTKANGFVNGFQDMFDLLAEQNCADGGQKN